MTLEIPGRDIPHSTEKQPRLPAGQRLTDNWPVLTYGGVPKIDLATWEFRVFGLVEREVTLNWVQFMELPQVTSHSDIHCVTTWSKYDNDWAGVRISDVLALAGVKPEELLTRFPASRDKALGLFRERYPALVDRVDYGPHRRIPRGVSSDLQPSLFEGLD